MSEEIRLQIGTVSGNMGESDNVKEIKFIGQEIASYSSYHGELSSSDDRGTDYTLYQTKNGFVVHKDNWSKWQGESSYKSYEVFESLEEMEGQAPDGLIYETKKALGLDPAETLDI